MNEILNCPNCGAPVTDEKCEYCGTVIYDFSVIDINKPSYIKIRFNGKLLMFQAILKSAVINTEHYFDHYYSDNQVIVSAQNKVCMSISAEFDVIEKDGVLVTERVTERR